MSEVKNEVAKQEVKVVAPRTVKDLLASDSMKRQFAQALPKCLTPDRFVRVALTMLNKVPTLADCTMSSVASCLLDCASLGIEPDGRRAHLIPFRDNKNNTMVCTLIIDYKGYIELARRSGELAVWRAELVCDSDVFKYDKGEVKAHEIDFRQPRGEVYAVYSYVRFKDGAEDYEVMTREEVEGIRRRSKAGQRGPWVSDFNEMAKKTVIRRHAKRLPLSAEFRDAIDKDADTVIDVETAPAREIREGTFNFGRQPQQITAPAETHPNDPGAVAPPETTNHPPEPENASQPQAQEAEQAMELPGICPECGKLAQFTAYPDGTGTCQECGAAVAEIPADTPPQIQKPGVCPLCGGKLTTAGCAVGYHKCTQCGHVVRPTKGGAK